MTRDSQNEMDHEALPSVLISVLTYNSAEHAIQTIRTLARQTYANINLQVVDNASANDCVQVVMQTFPELNVKRLPENVGYTGGCNAILEQAVAQGYDYTVICNHDIEVEEAAIEKMVETARAHPDAGVVGAVESNFWTKEPRGSAGGQYNPWISRLRWVNHPAHGGKSGRPIQSVHGALLMFSRRALEAGIRLDDNLFMFLDEVDLGCQLAVAGLIALVDQRVVFNHRSRPYQLDEYVGYLSQRNRLYIVRKYGRWYHRAFYNLYSLLLELPVKSLLRTVQGHPGFTLACLAGHIDGLRGRMGAARVHTYLARLDHE